MSMAGDALPVLEARGLALTYADGPRRVEAVRDVTLQVARGECVGIVGPSGSGKSSLLFLLGGLRRPDAGEVRLLGQPLAAEPEANAALRRRHVGFLFQEPFLVPYLSVRENALAHVDDPAAGARLERLAAAVGMGGLLDERPWRLSGGQRQRAGLLRALASDPDLVLADEPTAFLDQQAGHAVMELLRAQRGRAALVVVTHDRSMLAGATRVLALADGRLAPA
ncbi:MAG: ABC transporter ATP-binding protein [Planctomycetia bacterium]